MSRRPTLNPETAIQALVKVLKRGPRTTTQLAEIIGGDRHHLSRLLHTRPDLFDLVRERQGPIPAQFTLRASP